MYNVACTVGHSILKNGSCTSADGTKSNGVNEYQWCKTFAPILVEVFNAQEGYKATLIQCPERQFTSSTEERNYKLSRINDKGYDLVIESHLNAYNSSAKGTETLYSKGSSKGKVVAQRVNDKLDDIFTDREIKGRDDLYILTKTKPVAILNEYFFCDNKEDYHKADTVEEMRIIALKVVEGVMNMTPKNPFTQPNNPVGKETFFRVIAGSFKDRNNAERIKNELIANGHSAFLEVYTK